MNTKTPEHEAAHAQLVRIAAALVKREGFISPYAEDNPKSTPRSILEQAAKQEEQLKLWAMEVRLAADTLLRSLSSSSALSVVREMRDKYDLALRSATDYTYECELSCAVKGFDALLQRLESLPSEPDVTAKTSTRDAELVTDEQLNAAIEFHQRAIHRYKCEGAKVWRYRVRSGIATDEDKERQAAIDRLATPDTSILHCSCGATVTPDEYQKHLAIGHDIPLLPYICPLCNVQQYVAGKCVNCHMGEVVSTSPLTAKTDTGELSTSEYLDQVRSYDPDYSVVESVAKRLLGDERFISAVARAVTVKEGE